MSIWQGIRSAIFGFAALGMIGVGSAESSDFKSSPESTYFYRYRVGSDLLKSDPAINKDIVAFFIGAVDASFSEKLPIKSQWLGLSWKISKGTLPKGITFDSAKRIFVGTPVEKGRNQVVELIGYRADGVEEATAQITFDIFDLIGEGRQITLYAHTGKYKYDALPMSSSLTVDTWFADAIRSIPPGISVNGPYFEGIPSTAGVYPIYIEGMDYLGKVVVSYLVNYVVEDGPTFDPIPDDIRKLAPSGTPGWQWSGFFDFGAPRTYAANYSIDPEKPIKYFLRIDSIDSGLPGNVVSDNSPYDLHIKGFVSKPYDTVTAHFHAIDSDGTTGNSSSFTFGTGDPTPACKQYPYAPEYISLITGTKVEAQLALPFGDQGTVKYSLISGDLPVGISLEDGGRLVGVPELQQPKSLVTVLINVITEQATFSAECNYVIEVKNQKLGLYDATSAQNQHGRLGAPYSGIIKANGFIPDYTIDWIPGVSHPTLDAAVPAENQSSVAVTGTFDKAQKPASYGFNIVNGDTNTATGYLNLFGYAPLSYGDPRTFVPNFEVIRLAQGNWGSIPYDVTTVVPDTTGAIAMPVLTIDLPGQLPSGIGFNGRSFTGVTLNAEGQYGPFTMNMSDFTGESLLSDPFYVTVKARDPNIVTAAPNHDFIVEQADRQFGATPSVSFPPGAAGYQRTWALNGPALPAWAHFDPTTGAVNADPQVPYGDLAQPANVTSYGPYTLTVTDDDPISPSTSVASAPFFVKLKDMPTPGGKAEIIVNGTVSGDADQTVAQRLRSMARIVDPREKTVTSISVRNIADYIDPKTIVGTVSDVVFTHSSPVAPAGLPLQISESGHTAWFEGSPTEAFQGDVKVWFKDIRGRVGSIVVKMMIKAYPKASMTTSSYDLPRLAPAGDFGIAAAPCLECWTYPTWELDPSGNPLPAGLELEPGGAVTGSTDELDDETAGTKSPFAGIVFKSTSKGANGETLVSWTEPFQINIKPRVPMTLEYPSGTDTWYLNDKTSVGGYTLNSRLVSPPKVSGSHVPSVMYGIDGSNILASQGLNATNGVFTWNTSSLELGKWSPEVTATDSEGQSARKTLDIKATLEGQVHVVSAGGSITLRQSEAFTTGDWTTSSRHTPPIVVEKVVGGMTYGLSGHPPTVSFDKTTANFLDNSRFDKDGSYVLYISGVDADARTMDASPILYHFNVVPPLEFQSKATPVFTGRQYSPEEKLDVAFPRVMNVMDSVEYGVESATGGQIPGTVVYKVYNSEGVFGHWQWTDTSGAGHLIEASDPDWKDKIPLDALVFDKADMTLKGIPSKAGTFELRLVAKDTYRNSYLHQDDINYPVEKRQENNTAVATVSLDIKAAYPLSIVNTTASGGSSSESIAQYTQPVSMKGIVQNAAYGRPLTWVPVSGSLPDGISSPQVSMNLVFGTFAKERGTFDNIIFKGLDRANREISNPPITFTVGERQPFQVVATANPKNMAVNLTDADLTVSAVNPAYGSAVGKKNWTVTGQSNLPPGVSVTIEDSVVRFTGKSSKTGTFGPVQVAARDSLGATSSVDLTFTVHIPDGAILLDVSDIRTKQTFPFQMQAPASNTYGLVRYYSYDLTREFAANMKLDLATGFVNGLFDKPTKFDFDIYVTDETERVVSRPVNVEVLPFMRLTVPQVVKATETLPMVQTITTDYVLGTVVYVKGQGNWPADLTVDPSSGKISGSSSSVPGTYTGLTIRAKDTFKDFLGNTHVDTQESNAFDIALDGIPEISSVGSTAVNRVMLYTKDTLATAWKPTVKDKITGQIWNLPNTVYSVNKDFEYDTGLSFDTATGVISGTPTKLMIYTDMTITVTSPHGNTSTTAPFWFAVQPQGSIWAAANQTGEYHERVGTLLTTAPPRFENTVGTVTYTATGLPPGMAISATTGVVSGTPTQASTFNVIVTAKDGASRTAPFAYKIVTKGVLGLTVTKPVVGLNIGQVYSALNRPTATNVGGNATYTVTGLPSGMSFNSLTGTLEGSPDAGIANGTQFPLTVKIIDDFDGKWKEDTYTVTVALPILPEAGQPTVYKLRLGDNFVPSTPMFTNAQGAVTYSLNQTPPGLVFNPSTGVLSGVPIFYGEGNWPNHTPASEIMARSYAIVITVTDSIGRTGALPYNVQYRRPLTLTIANPTVGLDFNKSYSGFNVPTSGQIGETGTYSATGLPAGLSVNSSTGGLQGTIPAGSYAVGDSFPVKVTLTDSYDGDTETVAYILTIADPIVVPAQAAAYVVRFGDTLNVDLPKFDNTLGPVTFAQSGKPAFMTFDPATGALSGTSNAAFAGTVTITVTDSIKRTKTLTYTVTSRNVLSLSVAPAVNGMNIGQSYSNINIPVATNLSGAAAYTDEGGVLASMGLTLNASTGAVSGRLASGLSHGDKFQPVIRLRDGYDDVRLQNIASGNVVPSAADINPGYKDVSYPLTAAEPITTRPGQVIGYVMRVGDTLKADLPLFNNLIGTPSYSQTGKASYFVFSASDGLLQGSATSTSESTVVVTVKDATLRTGTFTYTVSARGTLGLALTPSVAGLDFNKTYAVTNRPTASNVSGTASFEDVGGVIASTGLAFNTTTGAFTGSVSPSLSHGDTFQALVRLRDTFDVQRMAFVQSGNVTPPVGDAHPDYREVTYPLTATNTIVVPAGQKSAYIGRIGDAVSTDVPVFQQIVGTPIYSATGVPAGLTLDATTGIISGTITAAGNHTVVLTVRDETLRTASLSYTITTKGVLGLVLNGPVTDIWETSDRPYVKINVPTAINVGGTASYAVTGLPKEFTYDPIIGAISGTVPRGTYVNGTAFPVVVTVTDSFDQLSKPVGYALVVRDAPAPTISVSPASTGYAYDAAATIPMTVANAKPSDTVALAPGSSPLPPSFSITKSGSAWVLSKTPASSSAAGVYRDINLRITDADGIYGETGDFDLIVRSPAFLAYPTQSVSSRVNVPLSAAPPLPSAGQPISDLTFAFSTDTTGGSLQIDPATGELSGAISANGTNVVTVTEGYDGKVVRTFTYNVSLNILQLSLSVREFSGFVGADVSRAPVALGTLASGVYTMTGSVPPGLTIDPTTGHISGTPTTAGTYNVIVTYSDGYQSISATPTITIIGENTAGHRYWKANIVTSNPGVSTGFRLLELDLYSSTNAIVTPLSTKSQFPAAFDEDFGTFAGFVANENKDVVFTFPQKVALSKAVMTSQANSPGAVGQTTWGYFTWFWSDNGIDWTLSSSQVVSGTVPNVVATATSTLKN